MPDYLKERAFFWDIDYTHNFITTERRVRQLLYDGGFEVARVVRSIGAATGPARDALAAGALLRQSPRPRCALAIHGDRRLAVSRPQESVRNARIRRAKIGLVPRLAQESQFFQTPRRRGAEEVRSPAFSTRRGAPALNNKTQACARQGRAKALRHR